MPTDWNDNSGTGPGAEHRIVVGVDSSPGAQRALEWAASQAQRTGARLDILAARAPDFVFLSADDVKLALEETLDRATAAVAEMAPAVVTTVTADIESPAKALIEAGDGADLLVVGSRGFGGFKGLLLGSVSLQCSLHASCPVVIVR